MEGYYNKNNNNDDEDYYYYSSDIIISNNINSCLFSSSSSSASTTSPPSTPSARATAATDGAGSRLYRARLILENHLYDELLNRYKLAMTRLRELSRAATALHEENESLRLANDDLVRQLNRALLSDQPYVGPTTTATAASGGWSTNNNNNNNNNNVGSNNNSPTSTIIDEEEEEEEEGDEERTPLPKSISVRSPGFFKLLNLPTTTMNNNDQSPCPSPSQHLNGARLRVKREEKALEMDVFNQGMYKTELCNKWQETGACPYGQQCQFAHGLSELRPVIRHPRYKTQVCRMVLAGVSCPYGHRCHFRHSLS